MDPYETESATIITEKEFTYHNAYCFRIKVPEKLGPEQAIYYDMEALKECCKIIQNEKIKHPIVYIMAYRIRSFMRHYYRKIRKLGGAVYLNHDGHEWMRVKWFAPIRKY